jgi:A/G-specific adenine glycosylase
MPKNKQKSNGFTQALLKWFAHHGRKDLPWQANTTPYRVWISEIMLQQTQVSTVVPYYQRFMQKFPDLKVLADAPIDEVLHLWTGLGYYARARNLHRAAQTIQGEFNGSFPLDFDDLIALPGICRSTAGAILAIAAHQRHAILDGNVKRVLTRFALVSGWPGLKDVENTLWEIANQYTPEEHVADYTQAIMDLGATLCTRSKPRCSDCPVNQACGAYRQGTVTEYPTPKPKKTLPVKESILLMAIGEDGKVLLEQRPPTGIWGGLWSFPELTPNTDVREWCETNFNLKIDEIQTWLTKRHTFSNFHLDYTPVYAKVGETFPGIMEPKERVWYNLQQPDARGLATPIKRLLVQLAQHI